MKELNENYIRNFIEVRLLNGCSIGDDDDLLLSGLLDSLAVMTLVAHLESARGMQIASQDVTIENFATVTKIASFLNDG